MTGISTTADAEGYAPSKPHLRGVLHMIAGIVSPLTGSVLIIRAVETAHIIGASVFALGLTLALSTSALYHRVNWKPRAAKIMQRVDHSMIFVLCAATYTPFLIAAFDGWKRTATVVGIWGAAVGCILLRNIARDLKRGGLTAMYLGFGWTAVALLPLLVPVLGWDTVALIGAGGLLYTLGAIIYATRWPNPFPRIFGFHEIFHTLVVGAAVLHYTAIWSITGA